MSVRELLEKALSASEDHYPDEAASTLVEAIREALAQLEEMEVPLKKLAGLKPQQDTVGMIHSAIIEHTGDGVFADYVWQLLTEGPYEARAILGASGEDE